MREHSQSQGVKVGVIQRQRGPCVVSFKIFLFHPSGRNSTLQVQSAFAVWPSPNTVDQTHAPCSQLRWLNATRRPVAVNTPLDGSTDAVHTQCASTSSCLVALLLSIDSPGNVIVALDLDAEPLMLHIRRHPQSPHLHRHPHTALREAAAMPSPRARCPAAACVVFDRRGHGDGGESQQRTSIDSTFSSYLHTNKSRYMYTLIHLVHLV
ncbi:hypothetical protein C8R43DRAFT_1017245 [Mycena crocata]|nr:hypothetical protein C8R43DRAFT_1017245 [Mycena crocata]